MGDFEPYYVVIFSSKKTNELEGYDELNDRLFDLVKDQEGFMGAESFHNNEGKDVTIVQFKTHDQLLAWKNTALHLEAQEKGRKDWYAFYNVKVCKVEREYEFNK